MKQTLFSVLMIAVLFSTACKKSQTEDPAPEAKTTLKGEIILHDEGSLQIDNSGLKISVENSSPEISTISDSKGSFSLETKTLSGDFVLVFEKQNIGTHKRFLRKSGDGVIYERSLDEVYRRINETQIYELGSKSTVVVNSMSADIINGKLRLNINISSPNTSGEKYIRVLLQKDLPSISIVTVNKAAKNTGFIWAVQNGNNVFDICLECSKECQDYVAGDKIYMTAYGESLFSNFYSDMKSGEWMFPNLKMQSNNPVTSFQMP